MYRSDTDDLLKIPLQEICHKGDFMGVLESKVVSLWEKAYQPKVNNRLITKLEACTMIANDLKVDYKSIIKIMKKKYDIHRTNKMI